MGRKTYWRALEVNTTLMLSKAIAAAGMTNEYISKDTKKEALILPMVALLHRSLTLVPNDIRDVCRLKIYREQDQNILPASPHAKYHHPRTVDPRHFSRREFRRCDILTE
jgi:hypothetical protein